MPIKDSHVWWLSRCYIMWCHSYYHHAKKPLGRLWQLVLCLKHYLFSETELDTDLSSVYCANSVSNLTLSHHLYRQDMHCSWISLHIQIRSCTSTIVWQPDFILTRQLCGSFVYFILLHGPLMLCITLQCMGVVLNWCVLILCTDKNHIFELNFVIIIIITPHTYVI